MRCPFCFKDISDTSKFCPECGGNLVKGSSGSNIINASGDNRIIGHLIQGNTGTIVINDLKKDAAAPTVKAIPVWRSPITQSILGWIGTITGVIGLLPFGNLLAKGYRFFQNWRNPADRTMDNRYIIDFLIVAIVVLLLSGIIALRRITKRELTYPVMFGFGISGIGKRISLVKIESTPCPRCGGSLHYRNCPTKTRIVTYSDGSRKKTVLEKKPFVVCTRNADHRWLVDATLLSELG
ncbi:zinc ribbon domain-containing protein [Bifidobacterium sp. H1HS16N]|uniref:Zinc ribbon domain-containing protein n=1 Tax=Bifidobacterium kimbladii TaxID=1293826 RepID=A0ABU3KDA3_9BIFI|nr:zinc ribbon domain-containing protein [Bifidobacterium sp. H1HS16N]MDT7508647.1 zinc ribbon domain-containing protein [Bifidobacterium sp. H1HS16N]